MDAESRPARGEGGRPSRPAASATGALTAEALDTPTAPGSERAFGFVFAIAFVVVGLFPLLGAAAPRWWAFGVAAALAGVALLAPRLLALPNRLWHRFGLLLQRVAHPVVLAIVYFAVVTPTGLLLRAFGKDPLRLRFDPNVASYWIVRQPPGPEPGSMANQF